MKLLKKSYLLILPLMLLTSCEKRVFSLTAEETYLPEPTKISFTTSESTECELTDDDTLTFYQKYLKDLKFEKNDNIFFYVFTFQYYLKFEKNDNIFFYVFTFQYYYDFDQYLYGDAPLELRLGNFNYICLVYDYSGVYHSYVCTEPVPYLEMMNFLETNALVVPM